MATESQLREKLRKIEALFAGAGTEGERFAAEAALERVRERLKEIRSARTVHRDEVLDAGSMVAPSVSRAVPALWHEALSLLSTAAQHGHAARPQTVPRSSSVAGIHRA